MMKARLHESGLDRHPEIDRINDGKHRLADNRRPARSADRENRLALLKNNGWAHARKRALSGGYGIGLRPDQAEIIGDSWFNGEVIHFIVQDYSGPGHDGF